MAENRGSIVGGVILVMLGVAFLAMQLLGQAAGSFVLLGLGLAFIISHAVYRLYGFLVPGGVLTGLGAGVLAEQMFDVPGEPIVLGLGLGFLLIAFVDRVITHAGPDQGWWWPLIPGGILTLVGVGAAAPDVTEQIVRFGWPAAIIALGLLVIWRGLRGDRKR